MPRNSLRIIVDLNIEAVTCPGVILRERQDVYLQVCMLGFQKRTLCLPPFFPLLFHQKFRFERTFLDCGDPARLVHRLQFEDVLIELIQLNEDYTADGTVLAYYQVSTRDFLYPEDSLLPVYAETQREVLMQRRIWFSGISPRLEFSCKTVIQDSANPSLDYFRDRVAERQDLDQPVVVVTPLKRKSKKSLKRTKSYEAPTLSSTLKASDLNVSGIEDRPPFIVKRKDTHNRATSPSRVTSPSPRRPSSAPPPRKPRKPISFRYGPPGGVTGHASEYISEADCRICKIYQRYFGRRYWGHKKYYHPNNGIQFRTSENDRNTDRDEELEQILNERTIAEDSESADELIDPLNGLSVTLPPVAGPDVEYARLPYSPRLSRSRSRSPRLSLSRSRSPSPRLRYSTIRSRSPSPGRSLSSLRSRSLSPTLARASLRERALSPPGSPTHANTIHRRVQRALDENYLSDDSDTSVTSEEALAELRSSVESSITTPLGNGYHLSTRSSELTGKSHRQLFEESLSRIYGRLHKSVKQC